MSSHHVVRDEQEPALLVWQPGQISREQVGELLEWSPRVVVHQQALEEVLNWGIKLDAVWAHPEQLAEAAALTAYQQPVEILSLPPASASLPSVLAWLQEKKQHSLYLMADARADNFLLLNNLRRHPDALQVQVISGGWRYSLFTKGKLQKWYPEGRLLCVVAFEGPVDVKNIGYNLLHQDEQMQKISLEEPGLLEISGSAFWLGEQL